jgi:hypothetical protein
MFWVTVFVDIHFPCISDLQITTTYFRLTPNLRLNGAMPLFLLCAFMVCAGQLYFLLYIYIFTCILFELCRIVFPLYLIVNGCGLKFLTDEIIWYAPETHACIKLKFDPRPSQYSFAVRPFWLKAPPLPRGSIPDLIDYFEFYSHIRLGVSCVLCLGPCLVYEVCSNNFRTFLYFLGTTYFICRFWVDRTNKTLFTVFRIKRRKVVWQYMRF